MKIAVTAKGKGLNAEVDSRFGRAMYFVIYDTDTSEVETIDNSTNLNAQHGAGIQSAEAIANAGAKVLLTGHCGPNAFKTLNAAGIKVMIGANGTVKEAIESFEQGKLEEAKGPDVEGSHRD